jgi:hypothetical protein
MKPSCVIAMERALDLQELGMAVGRRSKSRTSPGDSYHCYVRDDQLRCTCPGFRFRGRCRHTETMAMTALGQSMGICAEIKARKEARHGQEAP